MVAAVLPIVRNLPRDANMVRALMLGIPFSANVGGIATPISTPPAAIAYGSELIAPRDMLRVGALNTVLGVLLVVALVGVLFNTIPALRALG